jgi:hypothetical protein
MPKKKRTRSCSPHAAFANSHHPERNTAIVESRLAGKSWRAIGLEYGLCHQRIRQIVESYRRYERYTGLAALSEKERAAREMQQKRRDEVQRLLKEDRDKRLAEYVARLSEQEQARARKFYEDLAETPAWEDAILHVQKVLGCDRETASQEILKRF